MALGIRTLVGEILVWTKAPFLFRNELVAIEGLWMSNAQRAPTRSQPALMPERTSVIRYG
ncbi:MAG: hypothetical protein QOG77_2163 [Solirubrobacteraceae bacterium]|nr:hypothetical protein [Solirubrobacteraceae bacterium]